MLWVGPAASKEDKRAWVRNQTNLPHNKDRKKMVKEPKDWIELENILLSVTGFSISIDEFRKEYYNKILDNGSLRQMEPNRRASKPELSKQWDSIHALIVKDIKTTPEMQWWDEGADNWLNIMGWEYLARAVHLSRRRWKLEEKYKEGNKVVLPPISDFDSYMGGELPQHLGESGMGDGPRARKRRRVVTPVESMNRVCDRCRVQAQDTADLCSVGLQVIDSTGTSCFILIASLMDKKWIDLPPCYIQSHHLSYDKFIDILTAQGIEECSRERVWLCGSIPVGDDEDFQQAIGALLFPASLPGKHEMLNG